MVKKLCLFHHVLTIIQLIFKNREIKKFCLQWAPQPLGVEAKEHLRNRMGKDTDVEKDFKGVFLYITHS